MIKRYLQYLMVCVLALGLNVAAVASSHALCHSSDAQPVAVQETPCHDAAEPEQDGSQNISFSSCCKEMLCLKCINSPVAEPVVLALHAPFYATYVFRVEGERFSDSFPMSFERPPKIFL